jgi:hypothetical protein
LRGRPAGFIVVVEDFSSCRLIAKLDFISEIEGSLD